jgi:hypothetical protein
MTDHEVFEIVVDSIIASMLTGIFLIQLLNRVQR